MMMLDKGKIEGTVIAGGGRRPLRAWALPLLLAAVVSCTSYRGFRQAQRAEAVGDWDQAVLSYLELVTQNPTELRYRAALLRAKIQASHMHFEEGKKYRDAGLLEQALIELQEASQLDPTNQYARAELDKVRADLDAQRQGEAHAETLEQVKERTQGARAQPPVLNPRSPEPIDLDFPEPVSVKQIYEALGKAFGINILFDPSLRDQALPIQLSQVTAQDALEILMRTAGHFYKVLDEHSIIIVPDTPQNRRKYEDLIIQTFFLSNADVKDVMTMLRSLVDSRKIAGNEQLNAIILRDTADKVKVAERIIRANDKSKAEVVVDVELMQLNTSKLQDLGLSLDSYQLGVQLDTGGEDVPLRFNDLQFLNANNWILTVPNLLVSFIKNNTEAQTLAKPQLRITEGEKARLNIGNRVPIPVTSFNTSNTVGSNVIPITSFQYQDVGILIELEPRVHHNEEISLTLTVEVSNIDGQIENQPIIGNRRIETTIRLKDGETNFLAGLMRTDETTTEEGIPGLSDIPVIGRLFGKKRTQQQRTDIVLTLTPHIIRRANITEEDLLPIWVGTEQNITFRGQSPRVESDVEGPFDGDEQEDLDPAERVRQRLRQLPPGLRQGQGNVVNPNLAPEQGESQQPPPQGIDLVPPPQSRNPVENQPPPAEEQPEEEPPPQDQARLGATPAGWPSALGAFLPQLGLLALEPASSAWSAQEPEDRRQDGNLRRDHRQVLEPQGTAEIELSPSRVTVEVGAEFSVSVLLHAPFTVSHLPSRVRFDPDLVEFEGASAGSLLSSSGTPQVLAKADSEGLVLIGASLLGAQAAMEGDGEVLSLHFRAVAEGALKVRLTESTAFGPALQGRRSEITRKGIDVVVRPPGEVPHPEPGEARVAPSAAAPVAAPDQSPAPRRPPPEGWR